MRQQRVVSLMPWQFASEQEVFLRKFYDMLVDNLGFNRQVARIMVGLAENEMIVWSMAAARRQWVVTG